MNKDLLNHASKAANQACDAAAKEIDRFLSSGDWSVSHKPDNTPVTEVDIAAEHAIKKVLMATEFNADFYGEETGLHSGGLHSGGLHSGGLHSGGLHSGGLHSGGLHSAGRSTSQHTDQSDLLWLVDPIDGTKSFVRRSPFYSTQIALMQGDELIVGVSNAPAYAERLAAAKGQGAKLNNKPVFCNKDIQLNEAYLSTGNLTTLAADTKGWSALGQLIGAVKRTRGYGDFCHYHQLCSGQADIVIESDVNILDIAALTVAVTEAGGVMTDLAGNAITQETTSVLAAANKPLHNAVLTLFSA